MKNNLQPFVSATTDSSDLPHQRTRVFFVPSARPFSPRLLFSFSFSRTLFIFLCLISVSSLRADFIADQDAELGLITSKSRSGLFTVRGPKATATSLYANHFIGDRPLKLDPVLLSVC